MALVLFVGEFGDVFFGQGGGGTGGSHVGATGSAGGGRGCRRGLVVRVLCAGGEEFVVSQGDGFFLGLDATHAAVVFRLGAGQGVGGGDVFGRAAVFRRGGGGGSFRIAPWVGWGGARFGTVGVVVGGGGGGGGVLLEEGFASSFRCPFDEHILEDLAFDRLGQVVVHAGFLAFLSVALDGGGGHGDDGDCLDQGVVGIGCVVAD